MNRHKKEAEEILDAHLGLFDSPPLRDIADSKKRTLDRLRSKAADPAKASFVGNVSDESSRKVRFLALASAAIIVLAISAMWILTREPALATVVSGNLYRVMSGTALEVGDNIASGDSVRTNDGAGSVLRLSDGSRVELRSHTEFSIERAEAGIRVLLMKGSVIVKAAAQPAGRHLYVQTRDVTVSVVGTVFLVNAEERGSRVAVLEGEVRVQQGARTEKLLPGQQLSTNRALDTFPLQTEIAWSREAESHVALLEQTAPKTLVQDPDRFEVAAIRLNPNGGGAGGARGPAGAGGGGSPCQQEMDPQRYSLRNVTVYHLISAAYFGGCREARATNAELGLLSGGPDWSRSTWFDIEATIPDGPPVFRLEKRGGRNPTKFPTPRLERLLQNLLKDRFQLVLRREMKEMPVYILSEAKGGAKLTMWKEGDFANLGYTGAGLFEDVINILPVKHDYQGLLVATVNGNRASMDYLATQLRRTTGRLVLNRTNISGEFIYEIAFAPAQFYPSLAAVRNGQGIPVLETPSLFKALEDELGLKLESSREMVEALVVESIERPSEN